MSTVIWHDLENGSYVEDRELWRTLAARTGGPILDVGAGTGRVTLDLARQGYSVTALDVDAGLVEELVRRSAGLPVDAVVADARAFELGRRFALCLVPMQTIQLLGGHEGRLAFLRAAARHLEPGGVLAIALSDALDLYDETEGLLMPLPDVCERDGVVYTSQPTAVRAEREGFVLERRREVVTPQGDRTTSGDRIYLDDLNPDRLEAEARMAGLRPAGRESVPETPDYVGSTVVLLSA
jgi:SAM-dependent methyltransferase